MHHKIRGIWVFGLLGMCAVAGSEVAAQGFAPPTQAGGSGSEPSPVNDYDARKAALEARLADWKDKASEYAEAWQQAPAQLAQIETEIGALESRGPASAPEGVSVAELESLRAKSEQQLSVARRDASELDAEAARRSDRRKKVPELLNGAKERLRRANEDTVDSQQTVSPDDLAIASKLGSLKRSVLKAEIEAFENELGSYEARGVLLGKRRDRVTLQIRYLESLVESLTQAVTLRRRTEIDAEASRSQALLGRLQDLPSGVRAFATGLANENARLAKDWAGKDGVAEKIGAVSRKLARAEAKVAAVDSELLNLTEKVEAVGLADTLGVLLRQQRADAPDVGKYKRFIRMRQSLIGSVQLELIRLRERRQELSDIDSLVEQAMQEVDGNVAAENVPRTQQAFRELFETQRQYLDSLTADYETYFQKLIDFDARQQELVERTERLTNFIDERVLWIPSGQAIDAKLLTSGTDALRWLTGTRYVGQLVRALKDVATKHIFINLLVLLALIGFIVLRRGLASHLEVCAARAQDPECKHFSHTTEAVVLSLANVVWFPGAIAYLGWQLGRSGEATLYTRCIAYGLLALATIWVGLLLVSQFARKNGVGEAHCHWPVEATTALRRHLRWLTAVLVPAAFVVFVFEQRGEGAWKESIGRLVFVAAMVAAAAFMHLVFREGGALRKIVSHDLGDRAAPWVVRAVHAVGVAVPILFIAGALRGYYWTALHLAIRYHFSLLFLFVVLSVSALVAHWSVLARRRMLADKRTDPDQELDLKAIEQQTNRLATGSMILLAAAGIIMIWADVMPAVGILREVELWDATRAVTTTVTDAAGVAHQVTEEHVAPVTLADLLLGLFIGILSLALMRNIPGLLSVSLLRRFTAGERYAYSTLVKYAIGLAGIVLAADAIGITWGSIQWLVAAVGLGLGFGLQEIFANFISGLIILFEQPIRVGDIVTVGQINGTVSKIRLRATWITGMDRKELVVPNKEFVTTRLINWSLSDAILRVDVPVGIAYGSDTDKTMKVLLDVAKNNRLALGYPRPEVLFLGFAESSLSFELRVFIANAERRFAAIHSLHLEIDRAFREAQIEIAFPQRDVHVRTTPADASGVVQPARS